MGNTLLSNITSEKALGVTIDKKLNISQQCNVAAKKTNALLGCINRYIVSKSHTGNTSALFGTVCSDEKCTLRRMQINWNRLRRGQ